jgi:hypothetical protein
LLTHFSLLGLVSGGRDRGNYNFELEAVEMHVRSYLNCLRAFLGDDFPLQVSITAFNPALKRTMLEDRLLRPIYDQFEGIEMRLDNERLSQRNYYKNLSFQVDATDLSGQQLNLVDGGDVDWTRKLLNNAKERLVISGLGSERVCNLWAQSSS